MHEAQAWFILEVCGPVDQCALTGMSRQPANGFDACAYFELFTKHFDVFFSIHQQSAKGALRLKSDKDDSAGVAPDAMLEVMANTPAGSHAAAGNDNRAVFDLIDLH